MDPTFLSESTKLLRPGVWESVHQPRLPDTRKGVFFGSFEGMELLITPSKSNTDPKKLWCGRHISFQTWLFLVSRECSPSWESKGTRPPMPRFFQEKARLIRRLLRDNDEKHNLNKALFFGGLAFSCLYKKHMKNKTLYMYLSKKTYQNIIIDAWIFQ